MHPPATTPIPITSPLFGVYCATQLWARAQSLGLYVAPALPLADQPALTAGLDELPTDAACWSTTLLIDPEMCRSNSVLAGQGETPAAARLAARRAACSWLKISVRDSAVRDWAEGCSAVTLTLSGPAEAVALARRALGIGGGQ